MVQLVLFYLVGAGSVVGVVLYKLGVKVGVVLWVLPMAGCGRGWWCLTHLDICLVFCVAEVVSIVQALCTAPLDMALWFSSGRDISMLTAYMVII